MEVRDQKFDEKMWIDNLYSLANASTFIQGVGGQNWIKDECDFQGFFFFPGSGGNGGNSRAGGNSIFL